MERLWDIVMPMILSRDVPIVIVWKQAYIAKDFQGKGLGKMLYNELERQLADRVIKNIYACIAWTDIPNERLSHQSVEFHKRMGFSQVAHFHRCGWMFNEWYDTVWMEKLIYE